MTRPETYSFRRYLEAKRTVDERALNRRVQERLQSELSEVPPPLDILEVGSGIGATLERVLTWDLLPESVRYTAVDIDPGLITHIRSRLSEQSENCPCDVHQRGTKLVAESQQRQFVIDFIAQNVFEFIKDTDRKWDLLIAQAFLDLTEVQSALSTLCAAVASGGFLYFPITFDGGTTLAPSIDPEFDDRIERRYHQHMERSDGTHGAGGDSHAGRHLLTALPVCGGVVAAAGSSDWVVFPESSGYPADEAYFLHHIIEMIRDALADSSGLESDRFDEWIEQRHHQIENGNLIYIAHQIDVFGRSP